MPKNKPRILLVAAVLILLTLPLTGFFAGNVRPVPAITRNTGTPPPNCSDTPANPNCNIVGFTCAFGNIVTTAGPAVITAIKTRDPTSPAANVGVADTKCNWAGDTDGDFAGAPPPAYFESGMDPLISDPTPKDAIATCTAAPCGTPNGGGVIFDVMFFNSNRTIIGFDIVISYDPAVLNLQSFDQAGLFFGGNVGCPPTNPSCTLGLASSIDNTAGSARLAQALETQMLPGDAGATVRLFRIRFNVVGAGSSNVVFTKSIITFARGAITGPLDHLDANMVFSTDKVFNVLNNAIPGTAACRTTAPPCGLGFNASYTVSPSPPLASGTVTFTATAKCQNCTGTLSYFWDFSSLERHSYVLKNQANGPIVSIDPKVTSINRVTLYVKDQATRIHNVTATRGLPLDVFVSGPSTLAGNAPGNFNGYWLGGVANYTGNWIFCPPAGLGAPAICNPVDSGAIGPTTGIPATSSAFAPESWAFAGLYTTNALTITDGAGRTAASYPTPVTLQRFWSVNVTTAPGVTPAFTVGATANTTSPAAGKAVKITATISYDASYDAAVEATNFIYEFVWGDGTANTIVSSTLTGNAAHVYARFGTFTVKVMATENNPFIALSSIQENGFSPAITATGPPPTVRITGGPPGGTTTVGTPITFHAVPSLGRAPYSYSWTGTGATPPTATTQDYVVSYAAPGTYTVSVTLTDADARTDTEPSPSFTVTAGGPTVDFTAIPASPTIGQLVTFTATTIGGTAPFTFSWDFGDNTAKGTDASPSHTYAVAGTYTVKVNATDYAGLVAKTSHMIIVTPIVDFSANPSSPTVGQSVAFTATTTGGTGPFTFSWDFGDGTAKGTDAAPTHTYSAAGSFTVKVNATDSANLVAQASHTITVIALPTVDFSANPALPTVSQSVTFTSMVAGGTAPFTFSWDFGDNTAKGTDASPSHTYTVAGIYTVKVNATDHTGLAAKASHTITVTNPGLCATAGACDFTISPTAPTVGDTVTFTATVSGGSSPYTYAWDFGDGMTGTGVTITRSYASANTYTVKVTVTDSTTPTPQTKVIQHTVTVAAASVPLCSTAGSCDFTFTPTSPNVGDSVTFSATVSGGTSPYTYTWDFGDGTTGSGSQASHTYTGAGSYTVKLTITDSTSPTPQSKIIQHIVTATTPVQVPPISQKIFGLDPIQFYGLVAVAILLGVLVGGLGLYSRRRRS